MKDIDEKILSELSKEALIEIIDQQKVLLDSLISTINGYKSQINSLEKIKESTEEFIEIIIRNAKVGD